MTTEIKPPIRIYTILTSTQPDTFWRRWHVTLSHFVRDYLYIPLGGSRAGLARYVFATIAAMGICGLWHGAGWSFVVWGRWHGAGLVVCHGWKSLKRPLPGVIGWVMTMVFVIVGWVVFRAADFHTAASILGSLAGAAGFDVRPQVPALIIIAALVSVLLPSTHEIKNLRPMPWPSIAVATAAPGGFCLVEVGNGPPAQLHLFPVLSDGGLANEDLATCRANTWLSTTASQAPAGSTALFRTRQGKPGWRHIEKSTIVPLSVNHFES